METFAQRSLRLRNKALDTLETALNYPDKKVAITAASKIIDNANNIETADQRRAALQGSTTLLPPRFMAALLGGLARLGGMPIAPSELETLAENITDAHLNEPAESGNFEVMDDILEGEEPGEPSEGNGEVPMAALPTLAYLATAETPEYLKAQEKRLRS